MRRLTSFQDEAAARRLSDVLYGSRIDNEVRDAGSGEYHIWVVAEDELDRARGLLERFVEHPGDPALQTAVEQAQIKRRRAAKPRRDRHKVVDVRHTWTSGVGGRPGAVTITFIALSALVTLGTQMGRNALVRFVLIASVPGVGMYEIFERGEVWRLLTPIFLHLDWMHLVFNMLWLYIFGGQIESRRGALSLVALIVVIGIVGNVAQFVLTGSPAFGGMSGVVYGLLGFVWLRGRFDPASGLAVPPPLVAFMLIFLVIGWLGILDTVVGPMANVVHTAGLLGGCLWGYLSSGDLPRRLRNR